MYDVSNILADISELDDIDKAVAIAVQHGKQQLVHVLVSAEPEGAHGTH